MINHEALKVRQAELNRELEERAEFGDYAAEYQRNTLRTEHTPLFVNGPDGKPSEMLSRVMHGAMGAVTEAAEVMDMLKKHVIYRKPFDPINLLEEVGDGQWYAAIMLHAVGFDFREAMERNADKLRARFGDKFTSERALQRDLAAERKTLEAVHKRDGEALRYMDGLETPTERIECGVAMCKACFDCPGHDDGVEVSK